MNESSVEETYYQKNHKVILKRAKDYYENDKESLREHEEINTEVYLKKKKIKRENMEETDTICLKKRNKN